MIKSEHFYLVIYTLWLNYIELDIYAPKKICILKYENKLYLELKNTEEGQTITKQIMETKVLPEGDILDKFLTKFTMNY
mgnify:CR=1 FL=1